MEINKIYNEDCLGGMKGIADGSVDMVLCDLPYGTTECKWDSVIPFEPLWEQYERIIKDNGAIVLNASQPFTSALVMSNLKLFKYPLVWRKTRIQGFAQAPYRFMTEHEDVLVFSKGGCAKNARNRMKFNPQGLIYKPRITCVKPSGTTSLVLGTSSGIHAWHNDYYIRRIRVGKNEAIYTYLYVNHPELVEDDFFKPTIQAVISVPQKAPAGSILRTEDVIDMLERVKKFNTQWVKKGHRKGANTNIVS